MKSEDDCGFARGYLSKLDKSKPSSDNLQKIADYLGVTVDYLLTGEEKTDSPYYLNEETSQLADYIFHNEDLRILMETSRNCDDATIKRLITIAKALKDTKDVD